jgi:hypothetical protein
MNEWLASQEAEERCQCQHAGAEPTSSTSDVDAKAIALRLKAALLRTFLRGHGRSERAFCATGSGGGIDNTCSSTGDGGGGGDSGGGDSGGESGGSGKGSGSGPGGLQAPNKKHDVSLPKTKSRITIDQADSALKQMGYKLGKGESKVVGKGRVMTYQVTDNTGHTATVTVDELKDLVYENAK